jgi:hypothetical protein
MEQKRHDALQTRDRYERGVRDGPGTAAHYHSASKTRVNALMALRRTGNVAYVGAYVR